MNENQMEHVFAVGDRVVLDEDDERVCGEIKSLTSPKSAMVLMDDTGEEEEWGLQYLSLEGEHDELEAEFEALVDSHMQEIEVQLEAASKAMSKAEELSEKYGLPFSSGVSPLSQSYTPGSYHAKFSDLSRGFVADLTGAYPGGEYDNEGWEHSAVC